MNDKEKQIEEMARTTCNYNAKNFESCVECIKGGLLSCDRLVQAKILYNAGYRKIPEDSVVLSREEYERLLACEHNLNIGRESYRRMEERAYKTIEELNQELANVRKETAREIFKELYTEANSNISGIVELTTFQIKQLAKQHGVEIGEENVQD